MNELDGFWAGAIPLLGKVNFTETAEMAGGWEALSQAGTADLIELGVPARLALKWREGRSLRTRGLPLTLLDPRYPSRLRDLPYAPPVLFVEGDPAVLAQRCIGVVGTRGCTPYGRAVARHLGGALAAAGVVVVSGLARGIDGAAHRAAVAVGRTVAVLAHGLDHTAPAQHRSLRARIIETGGACVTTWPDATEPAPFRFPRRNRWIAALSTDVVVVEAPRRSGALHTAQHALDLSTCELHVVPGNLGQASCRGSNGLMAMAHPVCDVDEWVADIVQAPGPRTQEDWIAALVAGAPLDEVARIANRSMSTLLADITMMELRGEVVRLPGQRYARGGGLQP